MIELKKPKDFEAKCFSCGSRLNANEINSNVGLIANSQEEFYCDECVDVEAQQGEWL